MECIILCGGLGTRLKPAIYQLPKSLAPIKDKPFLFYLLKQMDFCSKIVLALGHRSHQIVEACQGLKNVEFSLETEPMDTGGALKLATQKIRGESFFAMNGDVFLDCNFDQMTTLHLSTKSKLTIAAAYVEDVHDYGQLTLEGNSVTAFVEKGTKTGSGWINGGIYLMHRSILDPYEGKFSLERDVFPRQNVLAYKAKGQFVDIGTPEKYSHAQGVL